MLWLAWRQFRAHAALTLGATVVVIVVLVVTHEHVVDTFGTIMTALRPGSTCGSACSALRLIGVPALMGAFWGAPLLTWEFEDAPFGWCGLRASRRRRWLATKLAASDRYHHDRSRRICHGVHLVVGSDRRDRQP
ncbi:MAG: hypothetical protein R2705_24390 [Ilumatobacteraceae bacterium]